MDYLDFYKQKCLKTTPSVDISNFDCCIMPEVDPEPLATQVKNELDNTKPTRGHPVVQYRGKWNKLGLENYARQLVPTAESMFGCNMFVDKVYIYRSIYMPHKVSSWIWHYDNNPPTILKIFIYLTDVNDKEDGPFLYEKGHIVNPTRQGPSKWTKPPNNSRIPENKIKGKKSYILGKAGTTFMFYPNVAHRATIPSKSRHRDVCVLRIRPWLEPSHSYLSEKWTTSWEVSGVVPKNPTQKEK